jgi:hypothetical protein
MSLAEGDFTNKSLAENGCTQTYWTNHHSKRGFIDLRISIMKNKHIFFPTKVAVFYQSWQKLKPS